MQQAAHANGMAAFPRASTAERRSAAASLAVSVVDNVKSIFPSGWEATRRPTLGRSRNQLNRAIHSYDADPLAGLRSQSIGPTRTTGSAFPPACVPPVRSQSLRWSRIHGGHTGCPACSAPRTFRRWPSPIRGDSTGRFDSLLNGESKSALQGTPEASRSSPLRLTEAKHAGWLASVVAATARL